MATTRWRGGGKSTPQVNTITPANVGIGNTFTVTINAKAITVTATAGTVANVTGLLVTALSASTEGEFREITWTDSTTHVTATGPADGTPFTQTSSASGGTATNTTATTTTGSGPNYYSLAANWSGGAVPVNSDTAVFDSGSSVDCLHGLAQSAVTLTELRVEAGYTGKIGLPERNARFGYTEYRATYLATSATAVNIGAGPGAGSPRINLNTGTALATVNVYSTGQPEANAPAAFVWKGTHASGVVNRYGGSVAIAPYAGEVATVLTLRCSETSGQAQRGTASVTVGAGVTFSGDLYQSGGTVTTAASIGDDVFQDGGTLTLTAAAAITGDTLCSGTIVVTTSGSIGAVTVRTGGVLDFTRDLRAHTTGTITVYAGGTLDDRYGTIPTSTSVVTPEGIESCTIKLGKGITFDRSV
jgi:hypothetical protein